MRDVVVLGMNHRTAPVEVREQFAFGQHELPTALRQVCEEVALDEALVLSTCNRVEVYGVPKNGADVSQHIVTFLERYHGIDATNDASRMYCYRLPDSARHLFRVSSGLDSLVLGEHEILGQVKSAYQEACRAGTSGRTIHRLCQGAFHVAKQIRSRTGISRGSVSVGSVAVRLAERIFGQLSGKRAMVVGAGETSELVLRRLVDRGVRSIIVANRTFDRAIILAKRYSGTAVQFSEVPQVLEDVDVVISSTSSSHHILTTQDIVRMMPRRHRRSLLLIDLAVPRDIEPSLSEVDNVYLYNIDDLQGIVAENLDARRKAIMQSDQMIDSKVCRFVDWLEDDRSRQTTS